MLQILTLLTIVIIIIVGAVALNLKDNKAKKKAKEETKKRVLYHLGIRVDLAFGVDLGTINESGTQDEIVRIINLLAYETASVCVKEDTDRRNNSFHISRTNDASLKKREWSEKRNLALQILPELKDRLPHFSEFEPLKSYREEHLREKERRKSVIQQMK